MGAVVLRETISDSPRGLVIESALKEVYGRTESPYQAIAVVEAEMWGRCLILDGHMQSAERDEHCYHESLVHPALLAHPNPKRVFVGGGGEGATCREVLRHRGVERLVMVDIDEACVDLCKEHLPSFHAGAFEDKRCEVVIGDAKAWLEKTEEKFDVIILDLADPLEEGPCALLYTQKFYEMAATKLSEGGVLVTQSGPAGELSHHYCFTAIHKTLKQVFPSVVAHSVFVPSFVDHWGFNIAVKAKKEEGKAAEAEASAAGAAGAAAAAAAGASGYDPRELGAAEINRRLEERLGKEGVDSLKHLDGETLVQQCLFNKGTRKAFAEEKRIITEESPLYIP